jgi:N-hydroxyarylamine O-acetyltransferase
LRVHAEGSSWLADVGFGAGALLEPLPFDPGEVHEQSGWRYCLIEDGQERVLQIADGQGWTDLYGFVPQPVPFVDIETSNWYTTAHPRSPFVTGLIVSTQDQDGTRTMLSNWSGEPSLTEQTPTRKDTVTSVAQKQIPALLAERFGLPGFALNDDGRVVRASRG